MELKTSEALRFACSQLGVFGPAPSGFSSSAQREELRFLCHARARVPDPDEAEAFYFTLVSALRGYGYTGGGTAFFYSGNDAEQDEYWLDTHYRELTMTARIVWCLLVAKIREDQGD